MKHTTDLELTKKVNELVQQVNYLTNANNTMDETLFQLMTHPIIRVLFNKRLKAWAKARDTIIMPLDEPPTMIDTVLDDEESDDDA